MRLIRISKKLVLICFGLVLVTSYIVNPGYYDRIYASIYNEYSKVCNYCNSAGHGDLYCPRKAVEDGALGRWVIPGVGVNVACYTASDDAQAITDAKDSAAVVKKSNMMLLADHNYQGFNVIKKCELGTIAYMYTGFGMQKYVCTDILVGYNTGSDLVDLDGNIIEFEGGFTNYTCHFFSDKITVVHFAPV